jgi:hypothetical protein
MLSEARKVETLFPDNGHAPVGHWKVIGSNRGHPADGMTIHVSMGDGAYSTIINPTSFADGGPVWVMAYGNPESIRHSVASLLETFDHLLSDNITMAEATRRLRIMRAVRRAALKEGGADAG